MYWRRYVSKQTQLYVTKSCDVRISTTNVLHIVRASWEPRVMPAWDPQAYTYADPYGYTRCLIHSTRKIPQDILSDAPHIRKFVPVWQRVRCVARPCTLNGNFSIVCRTEFMSRTIKTFIFCHIFSLNSLRPSDTFMRRQSYHHWFR